MDKPYTTKMVKFLGWFFIVYSSFGILLSLLELIRHVNEGTLGIFFTVFFNELIFKNIDFTLAVIFVLALLLCGLAILTKKIIFKKTIVTIFLLNILNDFYKLSIRYNELSEIEIILVLIDSILTIFVIWLLTRGNLKDYYRIMY